MFLKQVTVCVTRILASAIAMVHQSGARVRAPAAERQKVNAALAAALADESVAAKLEAMTSEVALADVASMAGPILAGQVKGRTVVDCR